MNVAYKWYCHNNNIIQFYSDYSPSRIICSQKDNFDRERIDASYSYASNLLIIPDEIKLIS